MEGPRSRANQRAKPLQISKSRGPPALLLVEGWRQEVAPGGTGVTRQKPDYSGPVWWEGGGETGDEAEAGERP